jgi:hypothetical protein
MLSGLVNNTQRLIGYRCHAPNISINRSSRHVALSQLIELPYMTLLWGVDALLESLASASPHQPYRLRGHGGMRWLPCVRISDQCRDLIVIGDSLVLTQFDDLKRSFRCGLSKLRIPSLDQKHQGDMLQPLQRPPRGIVAFGEHPQTGNPLRGAAPLLQGVCDPPGS